MTMQIRTVLLAAVAALGVSGAAAQSDFPTRPISLVVPTGPGGGTDTWARQLVDVAQPLFKQPLVIENKPGSSGTIGATQALSSKPDGYTLLFFWNGPMTSTPHTLPVAYNDKTYAAVMSVGYSAYVLCTRPDFPAKDAKELFALLKDTPNKYTYSNDGIGGNAQLSVERIFAKVGAKAKAIPFGGAAEAARNLLGGHVDMYVGSVSTIAPHVKAGTAKCLFLSSADDNPILPGVPGLAKLGWPEEETVLWWGMVAPAGTPKPVLAELEQLFMKAADSEKFKQAMAAQGAVWRPRGSEATAKLLREEYTALGEVVKQLGLPQGGQ